MQFLDGTNLELHDRNCRRFSLRLKLIKRRKDDGNTRVGPGPSVPSQTMAWRRERRWRALKRFARSMDGLKWSSALMRMLLEEMWVDEELKYLLGRPERLRRAQYPQALAVALALRHSWRSDDFRGITKRLATDRKGR